jgi:hypothetical protein
MNEDQILAILAKQKFKQFIKNEYIKIEHYDDVNKVAVASFNIGDLYGRVCMKNKHFDSFVKSFDLDKLYKNQVKGVEDGKKEEA